MPIARRSMSESSPLLAANFQERPSRRFSEGTTRSERGHIPSTCPGLVFVKRWHTEAGAEPGINPRRDSAALRYGHFKQDCVIHIIDYSTADMNLKRLSNEEFVEMCREEQMEMGIPEEEGATDKDSVVETDYEAEVPSEPRSVRWITIGGIDWEVLSALALRYNLHSLALEDILHEQGHNQSKVDYYHRHLFLRILCHWVEHPEDQARSQDDQGDLEGVEVDSCRLDDHQASLVMSPEISRIEGEISPPSSDGSGSNKETQAQNSQRGWKFYLPSWSALHDSREKVTASEVEYETRVQQLRRISTLKGDRVDVRHEPMFIFSIRDGTVISIQPSPNLEFIRPIEERLRHSDSILRASADASILVESLLDLVVDRVLEVVQEYQHNIIELEQEILSNPQMSTVRYLHILSGDLIMHKRTLEPIRRMIDGLRRYDSDRWAALADSMKGEKSCFDDGLPKAKDGAKQVRKGGPGKRKGAGYFSYRAKLLLTDVQDHMEFALASIDMFSGISENLINYAFNIASYEMNASIRRLTLATIIFLPLTLLTGYFGMNFQPFWAVDEHSDLFFWKVAVPLMVGLLPIFLYSDIVEYGKKRVELWRIKDHQ